MSLFSTCVYFCRIIIKAFMQNHELIRLINLSLQNDKNAFRQIVESHQYMIFALAFRMLGNEEDAKDIAQDTFIRIWTHLSDFNPEKKFSTWIYRITANLCLDKLKRLKFIALDSNDFEVINSLSENFEFELTNKELGGIITALTNELSPKQKLVFTLRYIEELEVEEIIEITGLSAEKIKSNLYVARQTVRKKLANYESTKR